ncbi:MAG: bifunctional glutamate--cysteine ligase GshA/glutathione synthetase GshB [Eubacteriaceae bacterium]
MGITELYKGMELSTQILIKEAINRKIDVKILDVKQNFISLKKGKKVEYVKQATKTSVDTYISTLIMENKEVTKIILSEHGINVPNGISVYSVKEAIEKWDDIKNNSIVIKPKSTNFGMGVVILENIKSCDYFKDAIKKAFRYDDTVLIEEYVPGKEYRFLVIGSEVVAILMRIPANVKGDGMHTIEQLVVEKNKDPLRGKGYVTPLEKINMGEIEIDYLKLQGKSLDYIPELGEIIYLRENSNISTGGDSIDYTDEIIEEYKRISINAVEAVGAKICGVDMIIRDVSETPNCGNHSIIELNFNPALHIHNFPYHGKNRHAEKKVLDLLGF